MGGVSDLKLRRRRHRPQDAVRKVFNRISNIEIVDILSWPQGSKMIMLNRTLPCFL